MKFLVVALLVAAAAVGRAEPVGLGQVRQNLFATCFATDQEGWMVGELGRIFHTTDGGATWERQDAGTRRPFLAMSCIDPKTAWIAGKEGIVYATSDGGDTWRQLQSGSQRHIFALDFPNAKRGHGAGDFGTHGPHGGRRSHLDHVTHSRGREASRERPRHRRRAGRRQPLRAQLRRPRPRLGRRASSASSPPAATAVSPGSSSTTPIESTLFGIRFTDARHGFAVGLDSVILRTEDGGATWTQLPAPVARALLLRRLHSRAAGLDRRRLRARCSRAPTAAPPGSSSRCPIKLAANWIRSLSLAPGGRGLAVGSDGLVFRVDGAKMTALGARDTDAGRTS